MSIHSEEQKLPKSLVIKGKFLYRGRAIGKVLTASCKDFRDRKNYILLLDEASTYSDLRGYSGIIVQGRVKNDVIVKKIKKLRITSMHETGDLSFLRNGDVLEIDPTKSLIHIMYRIHSDDNTIIPTNRCNNHCISCPQPEAVGNEDEILNIGFLRKQIELFDKKTRFLGISGGEPTLLKNGLLELLQECKKNLPKIAISLLTNGRMFSYKSYADAIACVGLKYLDIAIPIYSYRKETHDSITQTVGSFEQASKGIANLLENRQNIELRIVVQKANYKELNQIADHIIQHFPTVFRVVFVGMEMSGIARKNRTSTWIPLSKIKPYLQEASVNLLYNRIQTLLYNFPLCKIDKPFWPLATKSISDYKIRFLEVCDSCKVKSKCSGIFSASVSFLKDEGVTPILF